MHPIRTITRRTALFLFAVMLASAAAMNIAWAQESFPTTHFAALEGDNEVPPVEDGGQGLAIMSYSPTTSSLEYRITVLLPPTDTISSAHFHLGGEGVIGAPIHPITFLPGKWTATGTWTGITAEQFQALSLGGIYINVHTTRNTQGQIRGQVTLVPNFGAALTASQEVPALQLPGTGNLVAWLDIANRRLIYHAEWDSLTGSPTSAHFHRGGIGEIGPPIHTIMVGSGTQGTTSGIWENLTDTDINDLRSGGIYVNIHTQQNQGGEIRGQVYTYEFFTAAISGANETTPHLDSDMEGTGILIMTGSGPLFGNFLVNGGTGDIIGAHIHAAPKGENGDIVWPLGSFMPGQWLLLPTNVATPDQMATLRQSGMYANFHTQTYQGGEARGQLIPSPNNIPPAVASVPVISGAAGSRDLSTWYDGAAGVIRYHIDDARRVANASIALFSPIGEEMASTPVSENGGSIAVGSLPSGAYFIQLVVDGVPTGFSRVAVVR